MDVFPFRIYDMAVEEEEDEDEDETTARTSGMSSELNTSGWENQKAKETFFMKKYFY